MAKRIRALGQDSATVTRDRTNPREVIVLVLSFVATALAGLACVVVPAFVMQDGAEPLPFWPLSKAIEQMHRIPSFLGLFLIGVACGYLQPRYWHVLGLSTVVFLPAIANVEMAQDPTSHNLWPIEFVIYGFYAIPGFLGAAITGVIVRRRRQRMR